MGLLIAQNLICSAHHFIENYCETPNMINFNEFVLICDEEFFPDMRTIIKQARENMKEHKLNLMLAEANKDSRWVKAVIDGVEFETKNRIIQAFKRCWAYVTSLTISKFRALPVVWPKNTKVSLNSMIEDIIVSL